MIRFFLVMLSTIALLLFGLANLHVVELKTIFSGAVRASLAFLLLGAFGIGFISATLVGMHQALKSRQQNRKNRSVEHEADRRPVLPVPPQLPMRASAESWDPEPQTWR